MARRGNDPKSAGEVDKQVGARIRARRLAIGMTQETLAEKLGITFQQVQKYEKGLNRVAIATLIRASEALNTSLISLAPAGRGKGGRELIEDPDIADFLPLLLDLNAEGRRLIAQLARTIAKDPKLAVLRARRRD